MADLKLTIQVAKATNLPNVEKKRDSSDPYVKLTFKCKQNTLSETFSRFCPSSPQINYQNGLKKSIFSILRFIEIQSIDRPFFLVRLDRLNLSYP